MINTPYVKTYHKGEITNLIEGSFLNPFPNRRERRDLMQKIRKPYSKMKGIKPARIQQETTKSGKTKLIYHYVFRRNGE